MILYLVLILPAYLANVLQLKLHLLPLQDHGGGLRPWVQNPLGAYVIYKYLKLKLKKKKVFLQKFQHVEVQQK